jgi:hypothetical protein
LLLRRRRQLLELGLFLRHVALRPFQTGARQAASAHTSEDQRNEVRRDAAAQRGAEDVVFDAALLEA